MPELVEGLDRLGGPGAREVGDVEVGLVVSVADCGLRDAAEVELVTLQADSDGIGGDDEMGRLPAPPTNSPMSRFRAKTDRRTWAWAPDCTLRPRPKAPLGRGRVSRTTLDLTSMRAPL